jgi:uncharacterized SAM-binding protein YcdF (DUF218 family)
LIYLHKILPIFVLPAGLSAILIATGLLRRKQIFCWTGLILLLFCSLPWTGKTLMKMVEGPLDQPNLQTVPFADAIVVLAGSQNRPATGFTPQWSEALINRFEAGIHLYLEGKAPLILFTNGWLPWRRCALPIEQTLFVRAKERGVPTSALRTTRPLQNTAAEAAGVSAALSREPGTSRGSRIILVTSAFHMNRARYLFEKSGFSVIPFPTDYQFCRGNALTAMDLLPSGDGLRRTETALREWYGYLYYRLRYL